MVVADPVEEVLVDMSVYAEVLVEVGEKVVVADPVEEVLVEVQEEEEEEEELVKVNVNVADPELVDVEVDE